MKEYYEKLLLLLEKLPKSYSTTSAELAKDISSKYDSILKAVMLHNDDYKRNLQFWPGELKDIQESLHQSIWGRSRRQEKFYEAIRHLKDDIQDLANMIKRNEEFDEAASQALDE